MTYTSMAKTEILRDGRLLARNRNQQSYGLFLCSRSFSVRRIDMRTAERAVARRYAEALSDFIRMSGTVTTREERTATGRTLYSISIDDVADRAALLNRFAMLYPAGPDFDLLGGDEGVAAFVGGAFLACGALTDPERDYHLEFAPPRAELAEVLSGLLGEVGFEPREVLRRGVPVIYFGDSEQIEDLLTFMECPRLSLSLMDVKITKELRNDANRAANCDTANIDKVVSASAAQLRAIRLVGPENLPDDLRELARLRLAYPEDSLRDLGARLEPPLSRSGVNHRLARIIEIAKK